MGMTDTAANALLGIYYEVLHKRGCAPEKCDGRFAQLNNEAHVMWMCQEARKITDPERKQRWLGFIQGCMWMHGLRSIEQLMGEVITAQDGST